MSNPHGKNEERGPVLSLDELLTGKPVQRPDCDLCDNGRKSREQVRGLSNMADCPKCKRPLTSEM